MAIGTHGAARNRCAPSWIAAAALALAALSHAPTALANAAAPPLVAVPSLDASLRVLNPIDTQHYAQAFAAMHRGDFATASALAGQVADPA